ncbi:PepSY-like domain-containing protein [Sphingobacterium kyonggiense]|uniref:PepSY-like domain-containing protein n=1 Tax=Sphingobacterium kyonggiense TaxID=714075 RepID=A0ABP7YYH0_9SPHI
MKKFLLGLSFLLAIAITAISCSKDNVGNEIVLPGKANTFITAKFKTAKVVKVSKVNDNLTKKEFEVILDNGIKIEFDKDGNWVEIEAVEDDQSIPSEFVPEKILAYLAINYPGLGVNSIEIEDDGYEIELTDGTDLDFDLQGNFVKVDE